ncbi:MAG: segregation ATPase FtsK/SpoIIIE, family [Clostridia bacterium]|nr:segregation ATPase FtsK/SpoIIIE, family [Clostridia bacterium]
MPPAKVRGERLKNEILGIALLAVALLCLAGFYTLQLGFAGSAGGSIGAAGKFLVHILQGLMGNGKFLLPLAMAVWGFKLIFGGKPARNRWRLIGTALIFVVILSALHQGLLDGKGLKEVLELGLAGKGGGLIGGLLAIIFRAVFGRIGTWIFLLALAAISFVLLTGRSLGGVGNYLAKNCWRLVKAIKEWLLNFLFIEVEEDALPSPEIKNPNEEKKPAEAVPVILGNQVAKERKEEAVQAKIYPEPAQVPIEEEGKRRRRPKLAVQPAEENEEIVVKTADEEYILPPLSLLNKPLRVKNPRLERDITERIKILEETLDSFGVKVKVTQVTCGPTVTRYEVQPAPGIKVSRIVSLADDIALSLTAPQVRIEAPIPGKAAVGIEVPNKEISLVFLREVLETPVFNESTSKLTVALGKDITGNPVIADLVKMPHLLIAGATGSGKSVCLNALICSMLFKATPKELKLLMIDPKMVELSQYNGIPHLLAPVITQPKKAATALHWMVNEMEKRYELFAAAGVKDISRFNRLRYKETEGKDILPYIVILIDELADLMMVAPADVEDAICRLAQMARAAGIHLVVATQRPSVDVITGLIKANISSRIAFAVSSQVDSRTILDMAGAEKLLGRGDMLFLPSGASKPIRLQGAYVSDREVDDLVAYVKQQGRPEYDPDFLKNEEVREEEEEATDELFPAAVRVILETGQASISMLQRRLRIGYTRAARLMDMMEARGMVSGYEGTKPREILINWEEYERIFGKID